MALKVYIRRFKTNDFYKSDDDPASSQPGGGTTIIYQDNITRTIKSEVANSIVGEGTLESPHQLKGDSETVDPAHYYGTDINGDQSFHPLSDIIRIILNTEITGIYESIFNVINTKNEDSKESYVVVTTDTSYVQQTLWDVFNDPNYAVGNFRGIVTIHDLVTNTVLVLQNTMGFDYSDALNGAEKDKQISTEAGLTLTLDTNSAGVLQATVTGMTSNNKRIHFCFERCTQRVKYNLLPANTAPVSLFFPDVELLVQKVAALAQATVNVTFNDALLSKNFVLQAETAQVNVSALDAAVTRELLPLVADTVTVNATANDAELVAPAVALPFITEWNMPVGNFTLPLRTGYTYDMDVDWGDGSPISHVSAYNDANAIHNYTVAGTYQIKITGTCDAWYINNSSLIKSNITKIVQWGDVVFSDLSSGFLGCDNLTQIASDPLKIKINAYEFNFSAAFRNCTSLTSVPINLFANFNIRASANNLFFGCTSLTTIPDFLFSNVTGADTILAGLFSYSGLTSVPANLFVGSAGITSIASMFTNCTGITSLPVGMFAGLTECETVNSLFYGCTGISSLPSALFSPLLVCTNFYRVFYGCNGITAIPADTFATNAAATTFALAFQNCSGLTSIPSGLFDNCPSVETFASTFRNCTSLTTIPTGLFDNNTAAKYFDFTFSNTQISSIATGLFDNNTAVLSFDSTFRDCSNLATITSGLFGNCPSVETFSSTFDDCTSLTTIPTGLFDNNTTVYVFSSTFYNCPITTIPANLFANNTEVLLFQNTFTNADITSIPVTLFANNTKVTSFYGTFTGCSGVTSIPSGIFDNNTAVTSFKYTFNGCLSLSSIPTGLFDNNTLVTDFTGVFNSCAITSIPTGLFDNNTAAKYFDYAFDGANITSIPTGLFDNNTAALSFTRTFYLCNLLETVPVGLFRLNTLATNFNLTFENCSKLQLNRNIFYNDGEESTRFLNKSVSFFECFQRTSFNGIQGEAPELWNCDFGTGTPTKTRCFDGAGNSLTSLSNYASIPVDWL